MILDPYSAISSNVCNNQLNAKTNDEQILLTRRSQTIAAAVDSTDSKQLTPPAKTTTTRLDRSSMDQLSNSSRSPSPTSEGEEEMDNVSTKSKEVAPNTTATTNGSPRHEANATAAADIKTEEEDDEDVGGGGGGSEQVDNQSTKSSTLAEEEERDEDDKMTIERNTANVNNSEISQLKSSMRRLESTIESIREASAVQISQLEDMLIQKNKVIAELEERLTREITFARAAGGDMNSFGPAAAAAAALGVSMADQKAFEAYLLEKSKSELLEESSQHQQLMAAAAAQHQHQQRQHLLSQLVPQLHGLGNVNEFGTLLGEELASSYAKAIAKRDPAFLAMAAAAAAASASNGKPGANNLISGNNLTETLSPLNGDDLNEMEKTSHSASTTPTSAMLCGADAGTMAAATGATDPLSQHSPLGATTVSDLGLRSYSPSSQHNVAYDKLQHRLRSNVERYMNETLNTLQISRCVRELLSMHNIGQRLFAKYVLGLSQGTVSELLSKPKPWDKLTEKGRDSYRKMHAWATDDRCINLLKSMVPRKGKDAVPPYKQEDPVAEERIAQILSEAQRSMKLGARSTDMFSPSMFSNGQQQSQQHQAAAGGGGDNPSDLKGAAAAFAAAAAAAASADAASDAGSDREEKMLELPDGCKSPVFNATALATINNFYRNFSNEPLNYNNDQRGQQQHSGDKQSRGSSNNINNNNKFADNEEQSSTPADIMKLCQNQLAKFLGAQLMEEDMRSGNNNNTDLRNVLALYQQVNPFVAQNNPELLSRLFSAGLGGAAAAAGGGGAYLPLNLESMSEGNRSGKSIDSLKDTCSPVDNNNRVNSHNNNKLQALMANQLRLGSISPAQSNGSEHQTRPLMMGQGGNNGNNSIGSMLGNNSTGEPSGEDCAASPLQRMASITNSLLSQSALPSLPSQPSRPTKAVLPPITQQQFDQYNNLNTEDIVKRVKEQLSQYSISQRLFGESVLGLSQGSVSDLLARPKPWHMLTQKGREPFIRMKMFLEDENAIHKLVASQYKIAPEKLMRTGSFVAGNNLPNLPAGVLPSHMGTPPSAMSIGSNNSSLKNFGAGSLKPGNDFASMVKYEQSMSPNSTENGNRSNTSSPELNISNASDLTPPPPSVSAAAAAAIRQRGLANMANFANLNNNGSNNNNTNGANLLRPGQASLGGQSAASGGSYMQPSVYELAALTSDLDTQIITTRIKETLMAHNIGQKIFGEVVLGLSQGSVSELLSKPKPWHMLSIKGREPFIRMQLWLNDTNNIEKLQALKNERREANKRRRTHVDDSYNNYKSPLDNQLFNFTNSFGLAGSPLGKGLLNSPGNFPLSNLCVPGNAAAAAAVAAAAAGGGGGGQPTTKKARILFTEEQKEALKIAFAMDPYPSSSTSEFLAKELNLSIRTITNWFHNHRMRLKQINTTAVNGEESNPQSVLYNIGRDNGSFDQGYFRNILTQRLAELKSRAAAGGGAGGGSGGNVNSNPSSNGSAHYNFSAGGTGGQSDSSPTPSQRFKYSSLFATQSLYSNNSCSSPGSSSPYQEDEEISTLDLSMSSHNPRRNKKFEIERQQQQQQQDDLDDDSQNVGGDENETRRLNDEDEDEEGSDKFGGSFQAKVLGSSRRKPQQVMSSSSRRKAAQPQQWVGAAALGEDFANAGANADFDKKMSDDEEFEIDDDEDEQGHNNQRLRNKGVAKVLLPAAGNKRSHSEDEEMDEEDQKTDDEEMDDEDDDMNGESDMDTLASSYQKLTNTSKAPAAVMSKMGKEDNSGRVQECVQ